MNIQREYVHKSYHTHRSLDRVFFLCAYGYITLFTALYVCFWFIQLPAFRVERIVVDSGMSQYAQRIQEIFHMHTSMPLFWIFPRKNIFLLPKDRILSDIYALDSRIQHASLSGSHPDILLRTTMFTPSFLYISTFSDTSCDLAVSQFASDENAERAPCTVSLEEHRVPDVFWVTQDGYVFDNAPQFTGAPLPVLSQDDEIEVRVGSTLSREYMSYAHEYMRESAEYGLSLRSIHFGKEGDAVVNYGYRWNVLVSLRKSAHDTVDQLALALRELGTLAFDAGGSLSRIDVRFGNKVFYK